MWVASRANHYTTIHPTMKSTLLALLVTVTAATTLQAQTTLRIRGSDTLGAKLVPQLAEAFKKQGGKVSFDIAAEGSSTAFTNLASGTAEIGMSSRKVKADERALSRSKGVTLTEFEVAWDMICVVVNKNNPVSDLKKKQVLQIFAGDIKDGIEVGGTPGPISIYTRNTSSGTYKDFIGLAMKGAKDGFRYCQLNVPSKVCPDVAINVDIFRYDPGPMGNKGWIELIRTGPGDFSKRAVTRWTQLTMGHSEGGYPRYRDGVAIPVPTEEEAFKLLRWPWIEPWERK